MIPAKEIDGELWIRAADAHIQKEAEQRDLRDYFAAKAMLGLLASGWQDSLRRSESRNVKRTGEEFLAYDAYRMADAMLKEREK